MRFTAINLILLLCQCLLVPTLTMAAPAEDQQKNAATAPAETNQSTQSTQQTTEQSTEKAAISKTDDIEHPIDHFFQARKDLEHYVTGTEALLVGTEKFITLTKTSNTANNKGVVILLADWQQPTLNPRTMSYLQQEFPNHGWTTFSIQPPNKPSNYPSIQLKENDRKEENQATISAYQKQLSALYRVIMEKVRQFPGIFILVSEGNQAAILLDIIEKGEEQAPHAMVMLSAYRGSTSEDIKFSKSLAISDIPILDLYLRSDHPLAKNSAQQRLKESKQAFKVQYRQRMLNNFSTGYYPQDKLFIEIQGWLKSIGW